MLLKHQKSLALLLLLIASLDLLAWWGNHDLLLAWLPWFKGMTFNTALGFFLLSLAVLAAKRGTKASQMMAVLLLTGVGLFACLSLAQDVFHMNSGLDQWLLTVPQSDGHAYPGRMSPLTAIAFMIVSMTLMIFIRCQHFKYVSIISHSLIVLLGLLVLQGLTLHLFHIQMSHTWAHLASMSVMTSMSFLLLTMMLMAFFQCAHPKAQLLLYSGLHLMYRLSYPQKFTLISLVMLIPLFMFMEEKWQALNASIEHSNMEKVGIDHVQQTSELALAIAEHRGMTHAHFSDERLFQVELIEKTMQIDEIFARNKVMDKMNQNDIAIPKNWQKVLDMWHRIKVEPLDAEKSWLLHSKMTAMLHDHLRAIGRESLLSYDDDPLVHDLAAFQLLILPELVGNLGKMRGQGAHILAQKKVNKNDLMNMTHANQQVAFLLHESDEMLSHAWDHANAPQLNIAYQTFRDKAKAFLGQNMQEYLQQTHDKGRSKAYFKQASAVIQAASDFNAVSMVYVQQQLSQRTQNYLSSKYLIGLTALWIIVMILYFFMAFYQSVMLTIQSLQSAVKRMKKGEANILSEAPTHDELGEVVTSFNSIGHELQQVSARMHAVVEYAVDGIVTIRASGEIYHINSAAEKIFAYQHGEVLGKDITMLMPESFRKRHQNGLKRYLETGEQRLIGCNFEVEGLRKNKETFPLTISINEMKVDGDRMFVAMMRDMSDYKKLEQQLRQSEKMEAIGELVGGVAHNFNNMLAAITGKAYLAKHRLEKQPEKTLKHLSSIESIVKQAASMIQQLLVFSKQDFLKRKNNVSFNDVIHDAYATSILGIHEDISITLNFSDDDVIVYCDSDQLKQLVLQLLNNASDAVAESNIKHIDISLSVPDLGASFYQRHDNLKQMPYVCLTVHDTGHGMNEAVQARIFDPFYTTKEPGKGTGLGLSSVLGSVHSHDGVVEVESEPNVGTSFHVYLPIIERATSRLQEVGVDTVILEQQEGMLLLVDDDELVLEAHQEVFEALGYQVLTASDGEEGLRVFEEHQGDISLVVTDVVMPKMDGIQMMQTIRQTTPRLPAVFITGYERGNIKLSEFERIHSCILSKPVGIEALSEAIQKLWA